MIKRYIVYSLVLHILILLVLIFFSSKKLNIDRNVAISLVKSVDLQAFKNNSTNNNKSNLTKQNKDKILQNTLKDNYLAKEVVENYLQTEVSDLINSNNNDLVSLDYNFIISLADNKKPIYPNIARLNNWQGEVKLLLKINNGIVNEVSLHKSSGFKVLDVEALKTAQTWLLGGDITGSFLVSIVFRLNKN